MFISRFIADLEAIQVPKPTRAAKESTITSTQRPRAPPANYAKLCREAIALAEDLNLQQFIVASDCKQVIGDIARDSQGPYGAIIREIKLRSSPLLCNFTFKSRAVNLEAHKLAKFSLCLPPGRHVWLGQPHDQRCIPHIVEFD